MTDADVWRKLSPALFKPAFCALCFSASSHNCCSLRLRRFFRALRIFAVFVDGTCERRRFMICSMVNRLPRWVEIGSGSNPSFRVFASTRTRARRCSAQDAGHVDMHMISPSLASLACVHHMNGRSFGLRVRRKCDCEQALTAAMRIVCGFPAPSFLVKIENNSC